MQEIDVRDFPPCEPLEISLKAAQALQGVERVKIIHKQIPYPLFEMLKTQGFKYTLEEKSANLFHVIISKG
ncbi:MAG: DUF2249 domain-containing protein [Candidatus Thioglobus sp.]|jgi:uncharacterized protein (DUF2249 family)|uniref:DUF2249 domain-containing protein n=1 Tax=uncultured Candidatus Thioglobus sp. TaxID=655186 RepID=UPI001D28356A|nr:DUF2249 domain-containing protein [Candidatus Thioglobus sp.]MBT3965882.1 DUF2249 domain-containing protein [Candidatus Thioglobus sp.]MBT4315982.1 DUF2249 domain-containing protein [Candidatus Thioglobus sp.]MBT4554027.1 DUF2249 domain-containing protein [Candidatus Thioglobus sp.]MBT6328057.1 DUF2249 domain-containing protein [Candidatus Thioglobus sp.]